MCRPSSRMQVDSKHAASRNPEAVVGWLAVNEILRTGCKLLRQLRAIAAPLFTYDEQQSDVFHALTAQLFGRRDLRSGRAFGVARSTAIQCVAVNSAGKERRHAVE